MNKITFEQIKEFLDFVLRNPSITVYITDDTIEIFNTDKSYAYWLVRRYCNDKYYIQVRLYDTFRPLSMHQGSVSVPVSNVEDIEFSLLVNKIKESRNEHCANNFNIKFLC